MMRTVLFAVAVSGVVSAEPDASAASTLKVAVVPFAALSGDLPQRSGHKAAAMLLTELKSSTTLEALDVTKSGSDPHGEAIQKARRDVETAGELRNKRKFADASALLKQATQQLLEHSMGLADIGELADALSLYSAVLYQTGRDEEAATVLKNALSLDQKRDVPLAATSALFAKVVANSRQAVRDAPQGQLLIESAPSGAAAFVDGNALGATPLLVRDVPSGQHLWRIVLPSGEVVGGVAAVNAGGPTKVKGVAAAVDAETRLMSTLTGNTVDAAVVAAAAEHAKAHGADVVLFGALSKKGKGLVLDAFTFRASNKEVRRLPAMAFDSDLLSAGVEFYNLTGKLAQDSGRSGDLVTLPTYVSADARTAEATKTTEVAYGASRTTVSAPDLENAEPARVDAPRKPLDPKRTPLKKR